MNHDPPTGMSTMPEPKPLIAANWKMNLEREQAHELALGVGMLADRWPQFEIALFPGFLVLGEIARGTADGPMLIGAQNCHFENAGAFTGEVSPQQLREIGAAAVLIGHSERRQHFGEDQAMLAKKVVAARNCGLRVIYCVGENAAARQAGDAEKVVDAALATLNDLSEEQRLGLEIAYEPVWAIGSGRAATPEDARAMHAHIREVLGGFGGFTKARILYGGSVNADNAGALMALPEVDGLLVGGAALELESFVGVIDSAAQAWEQKSE